jgi:hypothetical protein
MPCCCVTRYCGKERREILERAMGAKIIAKYINLKSAAYLF